MDVLKSARIEFNQIKAARTNLVVALLAPVAVVLVFWIVGSSNLDAWYLNKLGLTSGRYFDFYAPIILSTLAFFTAIQLTVLRIVGERAPHGTLDRDLLAISHTGMFTGKFFTNALIALAQCILILSTATILGLANQGNILSSLIALFSIALVGLALGLLFSAISKTKEQAVQLVPFALISLLILNGQVIDFALMPANIAELARATPLALGSNALLNLILAGKTLAETASAIGGLLGWFAVLFAAGAIKFGTE